MERGVSVILTLLLLSGLGQIQTQMQHDEAMEPGGKGAPLVESVVERIQASCIFSDDKLMLRRIGFVESEDGHNPDTYRDGYHGGIWQVSDVILHANQ